MSINYISVIIKPYSKQTGLKQMNNKFSNPRKKSKADRKMHPYLLAKMNQPNIQPQRLEELYEIPLKTTGLLSGVTLIPVGEYKQGQNKIVAEGAISAKILSEALDMQIHYAQ